MSCLHSVVRFFVSLPFKFAFSISAMSFVSRTLISSASHPDVFARSSGIVTTYMLRSVFCASAHVAWQQFSISVVFLYQGVSSSPSLVKLASGNFRYFCSCLCPLRTLFFYLSSLKFGLSAYAMPNLRVHIAIRYRMHKAKA